MEPRGLRNNNPGNIRLSITPWRGEVRPGGDRSFCTFIDRPHGYRALIKLLRNYKTLHGCTTLTKMIARWAPPADGNNTAAYIRTVSARTGLMQGAEVNVYDRRTMIGLAAAISYVENGIEPVMAEIEKGWELL